MKRMSTLLLIGILAVVLVGSYTGYLFYKDSANDSALKSVNLNLNKYKSELLVFDNKDVLEAINAKRTLGDLEADIVRWSTVIKKIRKTVPSKSGRALVDILSYSGTSNSELSMSMKTDPDRGAPYFDVADVIEAFDESSEFDGNFVSSISTGSDGDGNEVLTFLFTTQHMEEDPLDVLEGGVTR